MFLKEFYVQAFSFGIWTARKLGRGHKQSRGKRETFTAKAMGDGMGERREGGSPLRECQPGAGQKTPEIFVYCRISYVGGLGTIGVLRD